MNPADIRDGNVVARTEIRAHVRRTIAEPRRLLSVVFLGLLVTVGIPLMAAPSAIQFGRSVARGTPPIGQTGATLAMVIAIGGYLGGVSAINQSRLGAVGPLIRTSIPPSAMVYGRLASEALRTSALVAPPAVILPAIVGFGARDIVAPPLLFAGIVPLYAVGFLGGRAIGDLLRILNRRLGLSRWTKAVLALVVMGAIFIGTQELLTAAGMVTTPGVGFSIPPFIPLSPLQSYAGVVLAPLGGSIDVVGVILIALAPVAAIALVELTNQIEVRELLLEERTDYRAEGSREAPGPFDRLPSARIAWYLLLRTSRDPRMLSHLFPIAIGLLSFGLTTFSDPSVAASQGSSVAIVTGVALSGGAYCLNPMGDDREQLPLLLTSAPSVAVLLRGRAVAGVVLGLVVAVGIGTPLLAINDSPVGVLVTTIFAVGLLAAGTGVALGMGAAFPRFERREYMNVERAHPSTIVVFAYLFGSVIVSVGGLVLVGWARQGHSPIVIGIVWTVYLAIVGVSSVGGYNYAVRRFNGLTMDDV